jgi:hypothetical protein
MPKKKKTEPKAMNMTTRYEEVVKLIDYHVDPENMTRDNYKMFCERMASDFEGRLDAIREEDGDE